MISRSLALTVAGLAATGAAVLGAYLYERLHGAPAAVTVAATSEGALPVPLGAAPTVPPEAVPTDRPVFSLPDVAGKTHSITEWDGKALVVNFWATWCAPCRREIPLLERIRKEYASKGVEVIGIAVDVPEDVRTYVTQTPIAYPVLVGEQSGIDAARDFGVNVLAFPFTAFTDAKGRIITVHLGELHEATARAILGVVLRVDAGALTPAEARATIKAALAALPEAEPSASG